MLQQLEKHGSIIMLDNEVLATLLLACVEAS